jgi:hypothetical protein
MSATEIPDRVLRFLAERIDTVPQLEALLLLWQDPERPWSEEEIAARVYVSRAAAAATLQALHRQQLVTIDGNPPRYSYNASWDTTADLMAEVAHQYRRHLVRIATFIHSGASISVREFARAFDLKKER